MAATHKVKIAARLRPRLEGEIVDDQLKVIHPGDDSNGSSSNSSSSSFSATSYIAVTNPRDTSQIFKFPFSSCYDENSTQEEIFRNDVEPLIDVVYSGVTVTIFAYGVTSSGKTHTMQGTKSQPGVIPRVVRAMFERKDTFPQYRTSLSVSYMEIYKDEVYDLLVTRENAPKLPVRENDAGMVFVANLSSVPIESAEEFEQIYNQATRNRSVGSTNLNRASSRSHAVLTVEATMIHDDSNTTLTGKINLVDLAGSENNKQTGNDATRMAESAAINKSLSVLGQVVHALNQGAPRIPYRNSRLTRILQDALGGNSVALLICNLAPGVKFRQDTLNTLNFAVRTKNIENKPVVNERDNRPAPKPHFSAPTTTQTSSKAASSSLLQAIAGPSTGGVVQASNPTAGAMRGRMSLAPNHGSSRVPRASLGGVGNHYQSFALPANGGGGGRRLTSIHERQAAPAQAQAPGLTAEEIEAKISKAVSAAVEAEVARRLAEKEKEWQEEQKRLETVIQEKSEEAAAAAAAAAAEMNRMNEMNRRQSEEHRRYSRSRSRTPERKDGRDVTLPSGVLTPLLKKHRDLDQELKERLLELERKFEKGNKETQLADVLSPVSKKKTGRAYVALARAHSEKGDLEVALDLYRKAETYVPDNIKLKERIIEIEWAVKNGKPYIPSPKPPRKQKSKKSSSSRLRKEHRVESENENTAPVEDGGLTADSVTSSRESSSSGFDGSATMKAPLLLATLPPAEFGTELTNTKRPYMEDVKTPVKRQRRGDVGYEIETIEEEREVEVSLEVEA
ncbi:kinesin, variant 2 [Coprinopsis cinerea AmutBmut pab1-1]|nr:kinesin, variant 2 [Coprinopsis cinerea AmutBmut pab1-1]